MLGTLSNEKKHQWSQQVGYLVHAYNSTKCDATGYSPYFLMFGREARLPVDICFGVSSDDEVPHSQYVARLQEDLKTAYRLATEAADKIHGRNKRSHDKRVRSQVLNVGDRVLLKNLGLKGKHKLQSRWSPEPYVIVEKLPSLPVYRVQPEGVRGRVKTIHREHLFPIGQLVRVPEVRNDPQQSQTPKRRLRERRRIEEVVRHETDSEEMSESSTEYEGYGPRRSYRAELDELLNTHRDRVVLVDPTSGPESEQFSDHEMVAEGDDIRDIEIAAEEMTRDEITDNYILETDPTVSSEPPIDSNGEGTVESRGNTLPSRLEPIEKRRVRPVIRLTYDKPGIAKDQPITIVHRGIIITIG